MSRPENTQSRGIVIEILALFSALFIGVSLGGLGGGGSILAVPVFVYLLDYAPKPAIAGSLAVVGVTSLAGMVGHWRAGTVNVKNGLPFGVVAMVGAYLGARLAVYVSGATQLLMFGSIMLIASLAMFRNSLGHDEPQSPQAMERAAAAPLLMGACGLGVGVVTGLVGIGGGFMIVPALVLLGGVPMKEAVGTSLLVIALKSVTGLFGYVDQVRLDWGYLTLFTAIAVLGAFLGSHLVQHVPQRTLKRIFAVFLVAMSVVILIKQ